MLCPASFILQAHGVLSLEEQSGCVTYATQVEDPLLAILRLQSVATQGIFCFIVCDIHAVLCKAVVCAVPCCVAKTFAGSISLLA